MPSLTVVGIIVLALLIAAALFLMYEIGKLVGEKTAAEKFPKHRERREWPESRTRASAKADRDPQDGASRAEVVTQ